MTVGLRREDAFCRSMFIVGVIQIEHWSLSVIDCMPTQVLETFGIVQSSCWLDSGSLRKKKGFSLEWS